MIKAVATCTAGTPAYNGTFFCSGSSCYQLITTAATWNVSRYACMDRGGWLVTYDSLAEQQLVEYTFKGSSASWPTTECAPLLAHPARSPTTHGHCAVATCAGPAAGELLVQCCCVRAVIFLRFD